MADDWIKMRTDLYRDPKVCIIADALMSPEGELASYVSQVRQRDMSVTRNVMRNVTVGALVALWGVTRHRGKRDGDDLVLRNASLSVCDDIADLPGLGAAMEIVGWAKETPDGVVFPGFFGDYNADPAADAREKNAERQRRYRANRNATRDVTVTSQSNAREREEREKRIHTHTHTAKPRKSDQQPIVPTELAECWSRWIEFRFVTDGRSIPAIQAEAILMDLGRRGADKAARDIDFSIRKGAGSILDSDNDFEKRRSGGAPKKEFVL